MTIVTGTADYQQLFQGLASEIAIVDGRPMGLPLVKLSGDSVIPLPTGAATDTAQDAQALYLTGLIVLLSALVDEQIETNKLLRKIYN